MDARVVNVVRSSGCFLRVGSVGELVDALRDRCVAEGREFVATFVTRHWDEVSREVRAREGERTVTSGRRAREEGSEREEEEEEGRGTGKRARGDGETETETEMEMEETGKDEGNEGAVVENRRSVDGGTTVATTPTTATTTTSTKTPPPPPPPPPSLTERLLTQTRVAATPPKQKQKPKQKTPIATGDPPSFRVLGATILRGIHAVIHERDDALRRDMRALVDAINASHREIAALRADITSLVNARVEHRRDDDVDDDIDVDVDEDDARRAVARVSSPMDDASPNGSRRATERDTLDNAPNPIRAPSSACFDELVAAAHVARTRTLGETTTTAPPPTTTTTTTTIGETRETSPRRPERSTANGFKPPYR